MEVARSVEDVDRRVARWRRLCRAGVPRGASRRGEKAAYRFLIQLFLCSVIFPKLMFSGFPTTTAVDGTLVQGHPHRELSASSPMRWAGMVCSGGHSSCREAVCVRPRGRRAVRR